MRPLLFLCRNSNLSLKHFFKREINIKLYGGFSLSWNPIELYIIIYNNIIIYKDTYQSIINWLSLILTMSVVQSGRRKIILSCFMFMFHVLGVYLSWQWFDWRQHSASATEETVCCLCWLIKYWITSFTCHP